MMRALLRHRRESAVQLGQGPPAGAAKPARLRQDRLNRGAIVRGVTESGGSGSENTAWTKNGKYY
jgi:hypothetical protein